MDLFLKNGYRIGIFAEGTTRREKGQNFGKFDVSFLRLAKRNDSWIQPITMLWVESCGKRSKVIVNFGRPFQVGAMNIEEAMKCFMEMQRRQLEENEKYMQEILLHSQE